MITVLVEAHVHNSGFSYAHKERSTYYLGAKRVVLERKEGQGTGMCGIPVEQLKASGDRMTQSLCTVILQVYPIGVVPPDLFNPSNL